jgi:hypothetical protein
LGERDNNWEKVPPRVPQPADAGPPRKPLVTVRRSVGSKPPGSGTPQARAPLMASWWHKAGGGIWERWLTNVVCLSCIGRWVAGFAPDFSRCSRSRRLRWRVASGFTSAIVCTRVICHGRQWRAGEWWWWWWGSGAAAWEAGAGPADR